MCGIAGIWGGQEGEDAARARVRGLLAAMRHRGPDGEGTLSYPGGAAGMVRLALVDLTPRGQQPLWSPDRRVAILFNGEMYNFREERERLAAAGHTFHTGTDTEVVLALYLAHGLDFVQRLRGMYAVALFDFRDGPEPTLVLARDPFGIKPLYLVERGKGVAFASEVRALVEAGLSERRVDPAAIADLMSYGFILQPTTILCDVRMMAAGTLEVRRPGAAVQRTRFYRRPRHTPLLESLPEAAQRLRRVLDDSIRLHAAADAKVGAFLSGGVDSTAVVAMMRPHTSELRTYTLRFPDVPGTDESALAQAAARRFDCVHTMVDVTGADVRAALPRFCRELDQPSVDALNTWLVGRAAARDVKAVLSGLGGDELFAGYPSTRRMAQLLGTPVGRAMRLGGRLAHALAGRLPRGPLRTRAERLAARRSATTLWLQPLAVFPAESGDDTQLARLEAAADALDPGWRDESAVGQSEHLDVAFFMQCQLLRDSDATSMAHSLELRVPFVDRELVRFARTCADDLKLDPRGRAGDNYRATGSKRVLLEALRDVLPDDLGQRPKRGFILPWEHWLDHELAPLAREATSLEAVRARGLVDADRLARSGPLTRAQVWLLLVLELWCREVIDRPLRADVAA